MAQPKMVVRLGEVQWDFADVRAQEMLKVCSWTPYKNRGEWFAAIIREEPAAIIAAVLLTKQRRGENATFDEVDINLDDTEAWFVSPTGIRIQPSFEKKADGTLRLTKDGAPVPVLDVAGDQVWTDVETGDAVPLGEPSETSSSTTRRTSTSSSGSRSSTRS